MALLAEYAPAACEDQRPENVESAAAGRVGARGPRDPAVLRVLPGTLAALARDDVGKLGADLHYHGWCQRAGEMHCIANICGDADRL